MSSMEKPLVFTSTPQLVVESRVKRIGAGLAAEFIHPGEWKRRFYDPRCEDRLERPGVTGLALSCVQRYKGNRTDKANRQGEPTRRTRMSEKPKGKGVLGGLTRKGGWVVSPITSPAVSGRR